MHMSHNFSFKRNFSSHSQSFVVPSGWKGIFPFRVVIEARGYEMDSYGHVNNAVYLNWLGMD